LSFDPVTIDDLIGWYEQPAPVVWAAILELEIAGLVTRHYGNRLARIAQQCLSLHQKIARCFDKKLF